MTTNQAAAGESQYSKTQALWNDASKPKRQRLLTQARQDKNRYYALAFNYVPKYVREALMEEHKKSEQTSNIPAAAAKRTAVHHARV